MNELLILQRFHAGEEIFCDLANYGENEEAQEDNDVELRDDGDVGG